MYDGEVGGVYLIFWRVSNSWESPSRRSLRCAECFVVVVRCVVVAVTQRRGYPSRPGQKVGSCPSFFVHHCLQETFSSIVVRESLNPISGFAVSVSGTIMMVFVFPKMVDDFQKEGFPVDKDLQMISGDEKVLLLRSMSF